MTRLSSGDKAWFVPDSCGHGRIERAGQYGGVEMDGYMMVQLAEMRRRELTAAGTWRQTPAPDRSSRRHQHPRPLRGFQAWLAAGQL
jgi:hypothetical protein